MMQRVYVKVVGFAGPERHALNTAFRLSQDRQSAREWSYEPWQTNSPAVAKLALVDGTDPDASEALSELEALGGIGIIWVGSISPAKAWASFQRPLKWPAILAAMDDYFTPSDQLDVDLGGDTWPSVLESTGAHMLAEQDLRRVLLADPDAQDRMYLLTKLSSFGITQIDEAVNVVQAREFMAPARLERMPYDIVILDMALTGGDPWSVMGSAGHVGLKLIIGHRLTLAHRLSARVNGCLTMGKPLDPSRLNQLLTQLG